MKKFLQQYGAVIYLGGALGAFAGFHLGHWQWWAITIPTIILISLRGKK